MCCRRWCKWWTSGWHWKDNCNFITWNWWISKKNFYDLKFIMKSRNVKKDSNSKYLRSWYLCSKLYLLSYFYASLLMIYFEDPILIFYIWVPNLIIEVIMKIDQIQRTYCTTYKPLTKKSKAFVCRSTCLVHFNMLAPWYDFNFIPSPPHFFRNGSIVERTSGEVVFSESPVVGFLGLRNFKLPAIGLPRLRSN